MHDEREVRFVVAHPECRGGYDALELVGLQLPFDLDLVFGARVAEVGQRLDSVPPQPAGDAARVLDGECVDDAGARELRDRLGEPRQPLGGAREVHDVEGEALAVERPAQHVEIVAELIDDVFHHAVVRGRGGAQHGDAAREQIQHARDAAIVGPEVVAPIADAVRLVDHHEPDA